MDNVTHGLLGYGVYAVLKQKDMERNKKWYALAGILGAEIPDIDAFTYENLDAYLRIHRGITHALIATPFLALFVTGILFLFAKRSRRDISWKWIYILAFLGMCTHWLFDWFNTWGTGLLEPFIHSRYSLGFLPIVDPILFLLFSVGLFLRRRMGSKQAFQIIWSLIAVYILSQAGQNLWIKHEVANRYQKVVVAAGFIPGEFTVIGEKNSSFEIFQKSIISEGKKTIVKSDSEPLVVKEVLANPKAQTIAWWSPFYAITLEQNGKYAIIFDPRFYHNGESFVKAVIQLSGD